MIPAANHDTTEVEIQEIECEKEDKGYMNKNENISRFLPLEEGGAKRELLLATAVAIFVGFSRNRFSPRFLDTLMTE